MSNLFFASQNNIANRTLVSDGRPLGFWYENTSLSTVFQDTAGTTPVTAVGQAIARFNDYYTSNNNAIQATAGNRAALRSLYNRLTQTENFNDAIWGTATNITRTTVTDPLGGSTATRITPSGTGSIAHSLGTSTTGQSFNVVAGEQYVFSIWMKTNLNGIAINFYIETSNTTPTFPSIIRTGTENTWARYTAIFTANTTGTLRIWFRFQGSTVFFTSFDAASYPGQYAEVWGAQLLTFNEASSYITNNIYQRVGNTSTYDSSSDFKPHVSFDGNDNYSITLADNMRIGSGNFTLEFWLYRNNTNDCCVYTTRNTTGGADYNGWMIGIRTNRVFLLASTNGTTWGLNTYVTLSGPTLTSGLWYHIAVSKSGSNWNVYVNGVLGYTSVLAGTVVETTSVATIGSDNVTTGVPFVNGLISNMRLTKGTALYSSTFRPEMPLSSAPIVTPAAGNPVLLVLGSGTNASPYISDNSLYKFPLVRFGNPLISTAAAPTGMSSSIIFGGADYLMVPDNDLFGFGSNNFTIELYARFSSIAGDKGLISHFAASPSTGWNLRFTQNVAPTGIRFVVANGTTAVVLQAAWTPSTNTWYHIAAVRDANNLRVYVDGVQIGSTAITTTITSPSAPLVIGQSQTVGSSEFNGYLSNVRVVNGFCLYPNGTTFTPPALPLTNEP